MLEIHVSLSKIKILTKKHIEKYIIDIFVYVREVNLTKLMPKINYLIRNVQDGLLSELSFNF